jgi:hypothetical protein
LLELPLDLFASAAILLDRSLQSFQLLERGTVVERHLGAILTCHHV